MHSRRSFFGLLGGLAALIPGVSWASKALPGQAYRFDPQGEFYTPTLSPDFLELPPAVLIFEWCDNAAVPIRHENGHSRSIGVRRLHIWTRVPEHVLVYFETPFPEDARTFRVPLLDFEGYEALTERVWDVWEQGKANPVIDERGYHLGDIVWVTVGNRERVRHGIAWVPFADEVSEEGLASKMRLGLPVKLMECGVKAVGDKLTQEEKSAITGQSVVGDLNLDQIAAITGLTWTIFAGAYKGAGRGLEVYLESDGWDGQWGLSVWREGQSFQEGPVIPFRRGPCPYTLCREHLVKATPHV